MSELAGVSVVVTRPQQHADPLVSLIETRGGKVIRFPTIEIGAPENPSALNALIARLDDFDIAIFISRIAVDRAIAMIGTVRKWPEHILVAAIGPATTDALRARGLTANVVPTSGIDSEALLALPAMRRVAGRRIVIFRGVGGRALLGRVLERRGALVEYGECYRRVKPNVSTTGWLRPWPQADIVTITSAEGLCNLIEVTQPADRSELFRLPLVVASERIAETAQHRGWQGEILIAQGANDEALVAAVQYWHCVRTGD
ncbi:MAG: uroporphyrinogen-III synthase [Gammaproteobacteria bacterium]|nr:uroporphyrinogen-III synthase [Gammaproteobacteria bacterium]